jgi:hypothetical protein
MFVGMKLRNLSGLVWTVESFENFRKAYQNDMSPHVVMSTVSANGCRITERFALPLADHWQVEDGTAPIWTKQRAQLYDKIADLQEINDALNESNKRLVIEREDRERKNPHVYPPPIERFYTVRIEGTRGTTYACSVKGHTFYGEAKYARRFKNANDAYALAKALESCSWCDSAEITFTASDRDQGDLA